MKIESAYNLLAWAAASTPHGSNPYCRSDVIEAERLIALAEVRAVEAFAADYPEVGK